MSPLYQVEPVHLRQEIWEQGHITPWQLLRICSWKAAKGSLGYLCLNDEAAVIDRTTAACRHLGWTKDLDVGKADTDWDRWQDSVASAIGSKKNGTGLLGLDGVGYPVATAVLCIINPMAFPVLDIYALRGVYGPAVKRTSRYEGQQQYRTFAEDLIKADLGVDPTASIHARDQAAMRRGMAGAGPQQA